MPKDLIESPHAPRPRGAYSPALRAGGFLFGAGQSARDQDLWNVCLFIEEQTEVALGNVAKIIKDAGAELSDVVQSAVHLADPAKVSTCDNVYGYIRSLPHLLRTMVGSVLAPGVLTEINVVACAP